MSAEPVSNHQVALELSKLAADCPGPFARLGAWPGRSAEAPEWRYVDFASVRPRGLNTKSTMLREKWRNYGLAYGFECLYPTPILDFGAGDSDRFDLTSEMPVIASQSSDRQLSLGGIKFYEAT